MPTIRIRRWSVSYQTRKNNTRQIYVGLGLRLGLWLWLGLWVTDMLCNCWVYEASRSSNSDVFSCRLYVSIAADVRKPALSRFLANVNSCSCSLYVVVRPSVCRLSVICRLSVCRLSVTFVHPTQPIEIFGNVSAPCNTLVTWRHPGKTLRRSSQGNPSVGGLNQRVLEKM